MRFSYEEIYFMYGQYDTPVSLEFRKGTKAYEEYDERIHGTFKFLLKEREDLENNFDKTSPIRSEKNILFSPSKIYALTNKQLENLDRYGINCSDIYSILAVNLPRTNRFKIKGKKQIPNEKVIEFKSNGDWGTLNKLNFGMLHSRYNKKESLAPEEINQYFGLRKHFNIDLDKEDFLNNAYDENGSIKNRVRFFELKAKYHETLIEEDEIEEFSTYIYNEYRDKSKIIENEIKKSSEKLTLIAENYGDEVNNLKEICTDYKETVMLFGPKVIYLSYERFVHIYARHVAETQIGERFSTSKTVFQYKFEDIINLISLVLESMRDDIYSHFTNSPDINFRRMGNRGAYFDGHYYRVEIDIEGSLIDFHPYNINEE